MKVDRELQRKILKKLRDIFPETSKSNELFSDCRDIENQNLIANLYYLEGHGLVEILTKQSFGGSLVLTSIRITAKGIDFIEDDGGLSAILNTITIKIHPDTICELLTNKINGGNIPDNDK